MVYGNKQVVFLVAMQQCQLHKRAVVNVNAALYTVGYCCDGSLVVAVNSKLLNGEHGPIIDLAYIKCSVLNDSPQHVMMRSHGFQRRIKCFLVEVAFCLEHHGLIIMVWNRQLKVEEELHDG